MVQEDTLPSTYPFYAHTCALENALVYSRAGIQAHGQLWEATYQIGVQDTHGFIIPGFSYVWWSTQLCPCPWAHFQTGATKAPSQGHCATAQERKWPGCITHSHCSPYEVTTGCVAQGESDEGVFFFFKWAECEL